MNGLRKIKNGLIGIRIVKTIKIKILPHLSQINFLKRSERLYLFVGELLSGRQYSELQGYLSIFSSFQMKRQDIVINLLPQKYHLQKKQIHLKHYHILDIPIKRASLVLHPYKLRSVMVITIGSKLQIVLMRLKSLAISLDLAKY